LEDQSLIYCPLCGNKVPPNVTKCPVCATELQQVVRRKPPAEAVLVRGKDDYLRKEIPKIELPETRHLCPLCAMNLTGDETKCPRCGIPLVSEETMLECPECGALTPAGSRSCPNCGIGFEEKPEVLGPTPLEEIPPPPIPPSPIRRPVEPVPEAVTAVTAGPQAVPREGLVNGRGAVSGTGFVNGTGMINGTKLEGRPSVSVKRQKMFITRWQVLAVVVALVIVIPTFIYLSYSQEPAGISIDGSFGDWSDIEKHGMWISSMSSAINFEEWAVQTDSAALCFYLRVQGQLMGSGDVNSFYLFADSDNQPTTGYAVSGIGAEYLIQLHGWNGSVQLTSVEEFSSAGGDQYDWNAWENIGSASSVKSSDELEGMAELPVSLSSSAKLILMSQDNLERKAVSYAIPAKGGVLVVEQEIGPGVQSTGIVSSSPNVSIMRLKLTSEGSGGTMTSVVPTVLGASPASTIGPISLDTGETQIVDFEIDTSLSTPGSLVTCYVASSGVTSSYSQLSIIGDPVRAYVSSAPASIQIDGAFGDWEGRITADSDSLYVGNLNIDVNEVGAVNESAASSFYVSVEGEMCGGTFVPMLKMKPSGGGGGVVVPSRKTGEDILRIYIDSDLIATTGYPLSLSSKVIGADYLIEVRGLNGGIVAKSFMEYAAGQWIYVPSTVNAANDVQRIEVGISSTSIDGSSSIDFIVETTDWSGRKDFATAVPQGAYVLTTGILAAIEPDRWIVDGSTTSPSATAMSYQRKLFYDGTNYWSFYFDGSDTVYKYSSNGGQTWSSTTRAFVTYSGVNEVSIWYDFSNKIVYTVGDNSGVTTNVYVRRGTVTTSPASISWGSESTCFVSTNGLGGKNAFICKDASGYLWILSTNLTSTAPTRYDLSAYRSSSPDSVSAWTYSGSMLTADVLNQPNIKGTILPAGTGSDVWAIYMYDGSVFSRKYTGTWGGEESIYVNTQNLGNQDEAPASAVVDANGVVHVVYGSGDQVATILKPRIYYKHNAGVGWPGAATRIDSGAGPNDAGFYPSISLDSSTGGTYFFWIERKWNPADSWSIMGKKNVSGSWSFIPIGNPDTASPKQYQTSIYSVPGESNMCWQWTQNTTGTIEVIFDRIPEFDQVIIPVLFVILLFIAVFKNESIKKRK